MNKLEAENYDLLVYDNAAMCCHNTKDPAVILSRVKLVMVAAGLELYDNTKDELVTACADPEYELVDYRGYKCDEAAIEIVKEELRKVFYQWRTKHQQTG